MEPSFDLDINNYTSEDLLNFFKLGNTFSLEELANSGESVKHLRFE